MGYIGKTPTPTALTASDIADGIISTAKLADTSVTNAKLNADLISAETELAEAPADTDEFLISDAGVLKRLDASYVGGGLDGVTTSSGNVTISNGNLVLGTADKGIDFSANSALSDGDATLGSELFDDYEEGTWTATVSANSGSITLNTSNDECHYTKIGNKIFIHGSISVGSVSSPSGRLTINNKPFDTSGGEGGKRGVLTICFHSPASDEGSGIVGMIFESYSPIRLHNSSSGNEINANKMQGSSEIRFQGFYE